MWPNVACWWFIEKRKYIFTLLKIMFTQLSIKKKIMMTIEKKKE